MTAQDYSKVTKTILIGLPAVGKTTLLEELSHFVTKSTNVSLDVVSSDLKFHAVRKDKNHPITKKIMKEYNIPEDDFPFLIKTNDFIKKYGESAFRDFESAVILDMLEKGEFEGKIPNLGGKAMLHPKTAEAFKKRGYQVIYLKADLRTIVSHITKDFEAMLDRATITLSPTNGQIMEGLKEKFPSIAELSPSQFALRRAKEIREKLFETKYPLGGIKKWKYVQKAAKNWEYINKNEAKQYRERIKERDRLALEAISERHSQEDPLYEQVADSSVFLSGELKNDIKTLCKAIGIDDLSSKAKQNDVYTNSIRSIISGIDEVIPYTYDDENYNFREYFNPIIKQVLNKAPSSENPKLVHMLGIPGAGKTTYYREHCDEYNDYVLIGFDLIMEKVPEYHKDRLELGKMEAFKKWELPARIAGYELLRRAIEQKKNIYFDHGGTPVCHRELLSNLKKMGYETTMYYIDCDPQTAIERVANRERPFPAERMPERIDLVKEQESVMPSIVDHFIKIDNNR